MENMQPIAGRKCASKACLNSAETTLRIAVIQLEGDFCNKCARNLINDGLAVEEKYGAGRYAVAAGRETVAPIDAKGGLTS